MDQPEVQKGGLGRKVTRSAPRFTNPLEKLESRGSKDPS